jgi:hypothetical protein
LFDLAREVAEVTFTGQDVNARFRVAAAIRLARGMYRLAEMLHRAHR